MKPHLKKLILAASFALAALAPAQDLIQKTEAQKIAERIDASQVELINHIESQLRSFHAAVNTEGKQQEILDAFGTNAVAALSKYVAMRTLILQLKPSTTVPEPNFEVFVANQDGSVTYVAPPEPEIETPAP